MREPGLFEGVPAAEYHAGLVPVADVNGLALKPLSSTGAKTIVRDSPADYLWGLANRTHKDAFSVGSAAHELILEGEFKSIKVFEFDSWRKAEAQAAKKEAIADGLNPMLKHDLAGVYEMVRNVREHDRAAALLSDGRPEVSGLVWDDEYKIWFQVRFDWLRSNNLIVDLKTSRTGNPYDFNRDIASFYYDLQASLYLRAAELLGLNPPGFGWVVVQNQEPYNVYVVEYTEFGRAHGDRRMHTALRKYADGIHTGLWPAHPGIYTYEPPKWLDYEGQDND